MPNLASVLKEEVARLARKEIRRQTATMQKASAQHRRDIAALKRKAVALEKRLALVEGRPSAQPAQESTPAEESTKARFTAKGLRSQRKRLGLAAADYAKLVGVTPQSIYNWERGGSKPRQSQIAVLATLRGIGKKEVKARLAQAPKATPKKKAAPKKPSSAKATEGKKAAPKKAKKATARKKTSARKKATAKKKN
jgi:DNA-binding transcriptional regulator YiaG